MTVTICEYCLVNFAANSYKELQNRRENMKIHHQVRVYRCPVCGGTDWATTEIMIPKDQIDSPSTSAIVLITAVAGLLAAAAVCFYLMR